MQFLVAAFAASALAYWAIAFAAGAHLHDVSATIAAAVADPARPDTDTIRDADRKPSHTLTSIRIKSGYKVADYVADASYFTGLFSDVVGSNGHLYEVVPNEWAKSPEAMRGAEIPGCAATHPNVTVTVAATFEGLKFAEKLDLFRITQIYDLDTSMGSDGLAAFNHAIYDALKPGGACSIIDYVLIHYPAPGARADVDASYRVQPSAERRELEAAGFEL